MIRKVENYKAWIGKVEDIIKCQRMFASTILYSYNLPLFTSDQTPSIYKDLNNDDLILVVDYPIANRNKNFSLDFINEVNKT